jgi:hypothetical protein
MGVSAAVDWSSAKRNTKAARKAGLMMLYILGKFVLVFVGFTKD